MVIYTNKAILRTSMNKPWLLNLELCHTVYTFPTVSHVHLQTELSSASFELFTDQQWVDSSCIYQLVLCHHYYIPNYRWTYSMLVLPPRYVRGIKRCKYSETVSRIAKHQANVVEFSTINCLSLIDADLKAWEVSTLSIAIHQWPRPTRRPGTHFCRDTSWIRWTTLTTFFTITSFSSSLIKGVMRTIHY